MAVMSLSAAERFLSLLALLAGVIAVAVVVLRVVPAGRATLSQLAPASRWLAFAIAATAMAGSLYFSEVHEFEPCKLCWYQRIAMFSSAIVLLVAALRRDRNARWYVVPLAGAGIVVSIYSLVRGGLSMNAYLEQRSKRVERPKPDEGGPHV